MENTRDDEQPEVVLTDERWFAQISTHIVGVRHHQGSIENKQFVKLVPHGGSACKVCNDRDEQVGWIQKELAPYLIPLMNLTNANSYENRLNDLG